MRLRLEDLKFKASSGNLTKTLSKKLKGLGMQLNDKAPLGLISSIKQK